MSKKTKIGILITGFMVLVLALGVSFWPPIQEEYQTIENATPVHYNGQQFAGSSSCIPCHESIYKDHSLTAHHKTSSAGNDKNILGSFNDKKRKLDLPGSKVYMRTESDINYQVTLDPTGKLIDKSKIDMIIGSGTKGQSHLTFKEDSLFQLQASYFTLTDSWINSPGYPNFNFKRPVMDNCIKCHVTFARNQNNTGNSNLYERDTFMYGIDCERCHGPSQEHVDFRLTKKQHKDLDPMIRYKDLDRQLQTDLCAQCHAGLRANQLKGNPFSYVIGEKLEDYSKNYYSGRPETELDVHGNQYGLLTSSACFKRSTEMTCITCHDPHRNQRDNAQNFNSKCIGCHDKTKTLHEDLSKTNSLLDNNCIKCHMPEFPSRIMKVKLSKESSEKSVNIRTHLIGVYIDSVLRK